MPRAELDGEGEAGRGAPEAAARRAEGESGEPRPSGASPAGRPASEPLVPSRLTHSLSNVARADPADQAELLRPSETEEPRQIAYFCEARHDAGEGNDEPAAGPGIVSKWRHKERLKTTAVALVLCLNIGVDPPDIIKISPCARQECWVDPLSMQPPKALDTIGKNLQVQYERWQPRAKYRMHLDPTTDDVKKLALACRRTAKNERVLFHYNGHGVPRPTANGEVWVFNKSYTQYIPLSVYDLQAWVGSPCIYVLDCSAAGTVIASFRQFAAQRQQEAEALRASAGSSGGGAGAAAAAAAAAAAGEDPMRECILLAACSAHEMLPQSPDLPADVFTACLTTPIKVALRWFCSKSLLCSQGLTKDLVDRIPGKQTDRKTPLGELNWIFTAITDTIAWNTLPRALFQRLFRQDLLVASLFRNFLLAERIMHAANCTPVSHPRLPPTHQHPMWQAWDMAAEMCLLQLPPILNSDEEVDFQPSPFFSEQLTAFELWLEHGSQDKKPPEQLPIVLQVLLSQVHRLRALRLLGDFLDLGTWAVDLALSVGIFPYVLKLLQTTATDLRETLVFIWTKILALDRSCQDLVKDNGQVYFINYLKLQEERPARACAQAAFVLAVICDAHPRGQLLCAQASLLDALLALLAAPGNSLLQGQRHFASADTGLLVKWLCLCLGKLVHGIAQVAGMAIQKGAADLLARLLVVSNPEVRAAAVFALGCLVQAGDAGEPLLVGEDMRGLFQEGERQALDRALACHLLQVVYDASPLVRAEVALALGRLVSGHAVFFQDAIAAQQRNAARITRQRAGPGAGGGGGGAHSAPTDRRFYGASPGDGAGGAASPHRGGISNGGSAAESEAGSAAGSLPLNSAPLATSPAVFAAEAAGRFSSVPGSPSLESPASGSPGGSGSGGGGGRGRYASADAARVGGGLYGHLLESLCTLATDPARAVAQAANAVLRLAGVELALLPPATLAPAARSTGQLINLESAASAGLPSLAASASHASLAAAAAASKWHPRSLWRHSGKPLHAPSPVASSPSSPASGLLLDATSRLPYVLRQVQPDGRVPPMQRARSLQPPAGGSDGLRGASSTELAAALPESPVFAAAARYFARPLNDWETRQWVAMGHSPGFGSPHRSVKAQWQPWRVEARTLDRDASIASLRSLGSQELAFRLDLVESVNTECPGNAAVLLHPFRPLLVAVDVAGALRVFGTRKPHALKNAFHIASGEGVDASQRGAPRRAPVAAGAAAAAAAAPTSVVGIWQINQVFNGLLLAAAADGSVRVWRDYTFPRTQRLATAWQAVPLAAVGAAHGPAPRAVFDWQERSGSLFAAGGAQPLVVQRWDVCQELCTQQVNAGDDGSPPGLPLVALAGSRVQEHLLLAGTPARVRLYDLRTAGRAVAELQPHDSPSMVGLALEPGGVPHQLVTASLGGELKFVDFRVTGGGGRLGAFKTLQAHSRGNLSALAAHPHAPLLATGTTSQQVVKLWTAGGEPRGVVRTQTSLLNSQRIGPISCLAFHPHRPLLASGSADSTVSLFPIEPAPEPAQQPPQRPALPSPGSSR